MHPVCLIISYVERENQLKEEEARLDAELAQKREARRKREQERKARFDRDRKEQEEQSAERLRRIGAATTTPEATIASPVKKHSWT